MKNKVLMLIFAVALILKLWLLSADKQIHNPEVATWYHAYNTTYINLLTGNYPEFTHHSFIYPVALKTWMYFDMKSIWLRIPAVLISLTLIPLVYLVTKKLISRSVAVITALVFSLSAFQLFWSVQVRPYQLLMLFQLIYLYLFLEGLDKNRKLTWVMLGLTGTVAVLTEFGFVWLFLSVNAFYLISKSRSGKIEKNWLLSNFILIFLFLPYLYKFLHLTFTVKSHTIFNLSATINEKATVLHDLISVYFRFLTNATVDYGNPGMLFFVFLFISSLLFASFQILGRKYGLLILLITYLPAILNVSLGYVLNPILISYQIMISAFGALVILSNAMVKNRFFLYLFLPAFLIVNFYQFFVYLKRPDLENWNRAVQYLSSRLGKGDYISFYPTYYYPESFGYFTLISDNPLKNSLKFQLIDRVGDLNKVINNTERKSFCYVIIGVHGNKKINSIIKSYRFTRKKFRAVNVYCLNR